MRFFATLVAALLLSGCVGVRRDFHYARYQFLGKKPSVECWRTPDYRACVYRSRSGPVDPNGLVYFMHYAEGDEGSFERIGLARAFFARWAQKGPAPAVVSITYGDHWILSSKMGVRQTVLLDDFEKKVMPALEAKTGAPKWREIWGLSMGGYNAAELTLSRPSLWRASVLSCPALVASDPFTTSGGGPNIEYGRDLWRHRLTGSAQWSDDDPVALAAKGDAPPVLLQPNLSDELGFLPGAEKLGRALGSRARVEPAPGGHCVVDAEAAADFLSSASGK